MSPSHSVQHWHLNEVTPLDPNQGLPRANNPFMHGFTTLFIVASATLGLLTSAAPADSQRAQPKGIDVSAYHEEVDWDRYKDSGVSFGYIMASEGDKYQNTWVLNQYSGCKVAGLICGNFHVADPSQSSGETQAHHFIMSGFPWTADGFSLPGTLALGYKPKGDTCYGLGASELVTWIRDFSNVYYAHFNRYPVIATTYDWWAKCTRNDKSFSSNHALWQETKGKHPGGWKRYSFLEITMQTETEVGEIKWNGNAQSLKRFASNP